MPIVIQYADFSTRPSISVVVARMTVSDLLAAARKAHLAKKHAAGKVGSDGKVTSNPNYPTAEAHIREALRLRQQAHALDPQHLDPAWQTDQVENKGVPHQDLMAWFELYLEIP